MKFVLTNDYRYWWPVKVRMPNPDPRRAGQVIEQSFNAEFRAMPTDEAKAIHDEIAALEGPEREARQHDLLKRSVVGWDESIVAEDGQPIPYSERQLEELLTNLWVSAAFYRAWSDSMNGDGQKARRGN